MVSLSPIGALLLAQFLSAFADNMILFAAQAVIIRDAYPGYYLPFVQSAFLAAYILFSPWVGRFADRQPKANVLNVGNAIKVLGIFCMMAGLDPAFSYAVVGSGAVVYSPAKYGILPFLVRSDAELLKANARLESFTILAILAGTAAGGLLADLSIQGALAVCLAMYAASIAVNVFIPRDPGDRSVGFKSAIPNFIKDVLTLVANRESRFSLIGTGSFWMLSAVLRVMVFAWAPIALGLAGGTAIGLIIGVSGIGVAFGAVMTPKLISLAACHRTLWYGLALGLAILAFLLVDSLPWALMLMLIVGILGGIYVVPMNACLQRIGHRAVGAGKTIAVQNFIENLLMFFGVSAYTAAASQGAPVQSSVGAAGIIFLALVAYLFFQSRDRRRGR